MRMLISFVFLRRKYYGVTEKQTRALSEALKVNKYVKELILEDNWQTPEAIGYLMDMVIVNDTITHLNLSQCNIGVEGLAAMFRLVSNLGGESWVRLG